MQVPLNWRLCEDCDAKTCKFRNTGLFTPTTVDYKAAFEEDVADHFFEYSPADYKERKMFEIHVKEDSALDDTIKKLSRAFFFVDDPKDP